MLPFSVEPPSASSFILFAFRSHWQSVKIKQISRNTWDFFKSCSDGQLATDDRVCCLTSVFMAGKFGIQSHYNEIENKFVKIFTNTIKSTKIHIIHFNGIYTSICYISTWVFFLSNLDFWRRQTSRCFISCLWPFPNTWVFFLTSHLTVSLF